MKKIGVFIGRFQPFHYGHQAIVKEGLKQLDEVIIILGSNKKAQNTREPLSTEERQAIITSYFNEEERPRIKYGFVEDYKYNDDKWLSSISTVAHNLAWKPWHSDSVEFYLIGMNKDSSSYYVNKFPQWKSLVIENDPEKDVISSTDLRNGYYKNAYHLPLSTSYLYFTNYMNEIAAKLFVKYMNKKAKNLIYEHAYERTYKDNWGIGPHMTVDSLITQAGHILLIQRGAEYGHGKWAMPGGFINPDEFTLDACIRELKEETCIKVPEKVLRGSIVKNKLYDDPYRSNRARILTNVFQFKLNDVGDLPKVKGSDDAQNAKWIPISKFLKMREQMFEDHYDIICDMLKL
jgi:bifunctional NMN adenylyltransferase/nudix hydrolase